jgi:predicted DNA-binding protein (MmcQ/YjbR family)
MLSCSPTQVNEGAASVKLRRRALLPAGPAPYLARAHWVQIRPADCRLRAGGIAVLLRQSYDLVVAKLPKKTQMALQEKTKKKTRVRSRQARAHA